MALPTNAGFAALAALGNASFTYIAVGTGTGQTATSTTLATESSASGMARASADTVSRVTTTVSNDTMQWDHVFTSGATVTITEVGIFDASSAGNMLLVGDLSPNAPLVNSDTLTFVIQNQLKLGS